MSSFRRFVHLVLKYKPPPDECSLRNIDMLRFFPAPRSTPPESSSTEPSFANLPAPAITICPPYLPPGRVDGGMDFMLFGGDKVLATDPAGSSLLYDPVGNTVRTMPAFTTSKYWPISLTVGAGKDLYAMNTHPSEPSTPTGGHDHDFEALVFHQAGWLCRPLPPTPCRPLPPSYCCSPEFDPFHGIIRSYAVAGGGSSIWITKEHMGTYSFDTVTGLWSKVGCWALPFSGRGEYVPEHGLWFGLTSRSGNIPDDTDLLCAVDVEAQPQPAVRATWEHVVPPKELTWSAVSSYLLHLGSAKFCIARIFRSDRAPHKFAVFTGVEVERCGDDDEQEEDGGLRMVKHRSEVYVLPSNVVYWVI